MVYPIYVCLCLGISYIHVFVGLWDNLRRICSRTYVLIESIYHQSYLIYSCYTHERCRFGRGCLYAHSSDELSEWNQEYNRKKNEKLRKEIEEKGEVWSLEMASKILKGPEEDVN